MTALSNVIVVVGVGFVAAATLGLVRLPDVFTRAHAVAKADTVGLALVLVGMMIRPGTTWDVTARLVALAVFAIIGNPTATHAITRAARRAGVRPWRPEDRRDRQP